MHCSAFEPPEVNRLSLTTKSKGCLSCQNDVKRWRCLFAKQPSLGKFQVTNWSLLHVRLNGQLSNSFIQLHSAPLGALTEATCPNDKAFSRWSDFLSIGVEQLLQRSPLSLSLWFWPLESRHYSRTGSKSKCFEHFNFASCLSKWRDRQKMEIDIRRYAINGRGRIAAIELLPLCPSAQISWANLCDDQFFLQMSTFFNDLISIWFRF